MRGDLADLARSIWSGLNDALLWTPEWLVGLVVLAFAAIAALVVHRIAFMLLNRASGERHPLLRRIAQRIKGPAALALIAFALAAALQSTPFNPAISATFTRLLLIAFIVLAGWIAHIAVETGSNVYLRHFTLESDDNLLARKHVTQ